LFLISLKSFDTFYFGGLPTFQNDCMYPTFVMPAFIRVENQLSAMCTDVYGTPLFLADQPLVDLLAYG
jgi:hypothetical protein